jgi:uncharacterized membrane protein YphA (DoxX/SURF4 family)
MLRPLSPLDLGSRSSGGGSFLQEFQTIAVLRIGAGLVLFLAYGLEATLKAWHFIWSKTPFPLVQTLEPTFLPWPQFIAPTAAFITCTVAIAWIVGFYTRLFAALFLPLPLISLFVAGTVKATEADCTVAWLFLIISATLLLYGSGNLSVDALFRLGGGSRKKKLF